MTDLKVEARRMAEETYEKMMDDYDDRPSFEAVEAALLAFGRLVREEDAKVAAEFTDPADGAYAADDTERVATNIAAAIRTKALE